MLFGGGILSGARKIWGNPYFISKHAIEIGNIMMANFDKNKLQPAVV